MRQTERHKPTFSALCCYPGIGSVWLDGVRLRDGRVEGFTPYIAEWIGPWPRYEHDYMNFPLSCVRKWEVHRA